MQPFYALIIPMGHHDPGAHPEHPIAPGGPPPSVWPGPGPLPHPEHPIAGPPPSIWPSPGHPEHPIYYPPTVWPEPGHPEHPIVIPKPPDPPSGSGDPEHPINLPPEQAPPGYKWVLAFHPKIGWGWVLVPSKPEPPKPPGYNPPSGGNIPQPVDPTKK